MIKSYFTSNLRRRTSSFILASSIAVATIAVAGLTESPVRAAPVSFGQIIASRTVASNGSFNVYSGEEIEMIAGANVTSTCLGQALQPGDVVTMTDVDLQFSTMTFDYGAHMGISWTLPNPVPEMFRIDGFTVKVRNLPAGTKVFSPKVRVTRSGQLLVETSDCIIFRQGYARIDATSADAQNDFKDVSQYVARVGDDRLRYNGQACVDMALVEPGDVLTYSYELKTGGQEVQDPNQFPFYTLNGSPVGATFTIANPEPTSLKLLVEGAGAPAPTAGDTYTFSVDIKKGNDSVATNNCPVNNPGGGGPLPGGGGGPITMPRLYPTAQASLTGELTLGSTVSVSLPTWSLTDGGPALANTDIVSTQFTWILCSVGPVPQRVGAFGPPSACLMSMPPVLLANGTSFGTITGAGQAFSGSSLTITEPLVTALTGKHLLVSVFIEAAPAPGQMMGIYFNFDFKSCASGENCADSFGPTSTSTTTTTVPATTTTTVPATTTTTVPAATTTTPAATTTVPPPALSTVQALPTAPTPIVADTSISIGEEISVSFGGFTPYEFVQLIVASTPQVIGSGYANAQGVVTLSGNLPSNLAAGNHTLAVYAPGSGIGFTQPISVSQPALPATGSDGQNNLFVMAMLLFVLGLVVRRTSVTANKH
jgi:LPXTG-motif cell wall-anchored protein